MAVHEVKGPDGQIHLVEAPEGASPEAVIKYAQAMAMKDAPAAARSKSPAIQRFYDIGNTPTEATGGYQAARGMTFGGIDYPVAGINYALDNAVPAVKNMMGGNEKTTSFNDELSAVRTEADNYANKNPISSLALNLVGGLGPAGSVYKGIEGAVSKYAPNLSAKAIGLLTGGAVGGGAGALSAEGDDKGIPSPGDVAESTGFGTLLGVGTTMAAPYVAKGVGWAGNKISDVAGNLWSRLPFTQQSPEGRAIAHSLLDDNITPQMLEANRAKLGPSANVVDLAGTQDPNSGVWLGGKNTYRAADSLANSPGPTQNLAETVLKPRPAQAGTELIKSVDKNISPQDFYGSLDKQAAQKLADASPKYKALYEKFPVVSSPYLADLSENQIIKDAAKAGLKSAQIDSLVARQKGQQTLPQPVFQFDADGNVVTSGSWSMQQWDSVKKGVGRLINNYRDANGRLPKTDDVRDLVRLQGAIVEHLDDMTNVDGKSLYKTARDAWAGPSAIEDATWVGRDFMNGDREITVREFKRLSQDEQQGFFTGVAREVRGAIENTGTVPARLKNIMNPENGTRKILKEVLPADKFDSFVNDVASIVRRGQAVRMTGGSDTAARLNNAPSIANDLGGAAVELAMGNPVGGARRAAGGLLGALTRPSGAQNAAQGRMLLDPSAVDEAIAALRARATPSQNYFVGQPKSLLGSPTNPFKNPKYTGLLGVRP